MTDKKVLDVGHRITDVSNAPRDDNTNKNAPELKNVVFLHLDLGIGGAEALVLQLAASSQSLGHHVQILTTRCDQDHCFAVVKSPNGILAKNVQVRGRWIPANIMGMGTALCSNLRVLYLAAYLCFGGNDCEVDLVVLDVLPSPLWWLQWFTSSSLLFYCHFPDKLLIRNNATLGSAAAINRKSPYRRLMDKVEEWCIPMADSILVNSKFTQRIVLQEFPFLVPGDLQVLYPALDTDAMDNNNNNNSNDDKAPHQTLSNENESKEDSDDPQPPKRNQQRVTIVSLNRYERKKKIELILQAYALICDKYPPKTIQIVIAGGYDTQNVENVEYRGELETLAFQTLGLRKDDVQFLTSISDARRTQLLSDARCVVYTPPNEHFGIVPIEVMYAATPVIACNSGGPLETILDNKTGFLCDPTPEAFADAINKLLMAPQKAKDMGRAGRQHVLETFGTQRLAKEWDHFTQQAHERGQRRIHLTRQNKGRSVVMAMIKVLFMYLREAMLAFLVILAVAYLLRYFGIMEHDESITGLMRRRFRSDEF